MIQRDPGADGREPVRSRSTPVPLIDLQAAARLLRMRLWRVRRHLHTQAVPVYFATRAGKEVPAVAVRDLRRVFAERIATLSGGRGLRNTETVGNGAHGGDAGVERAESGLLIALEELSRLRADLARARGRLQEADGSAEAIRDVRSRLERTRRLRAIAEDRAERMRLRARALRRELARERRTSGDTVRFLEGERHGLRERLARERRELARTRASLGELEGSMQRALGVYAEARDLYGELSDQLRELRTSSRADLETAARRVAREKERRECAERELAEAAEGLQATLLRLERSEDGFAALRERSEEQRAQLVDEVASLRAALEEAEACVGSLTRELDGERRSSADLTRRVDELQGDLFATERELDTSRGHVRFLEQQVERERNARREASEQAGALERSLRTADEVERALQVYIDRREEELGRVRDALRRTRNGLRRLGEIA